jgi:hypothetical protein
VKGVNYSRIEEGRKIREKNKLRHESTKPINEMPCQQKLVDQHC